MTDQKIVKKALELYSQGKSFSQIGRHLKINKGTICRWAKKWSWSQMTETEVSEAIKINNVLETLEVVRAHREVELPVILRPPEGQTFASYIMQAARQISLQSVEIAARVVSNLHDQTSISTDDLRQLHGAVDLFIKIQRDLMPPDVISTQTRVVEYILPDEDEITRFKAKQ